MIFRLMFMLRRRHKPGVELATRRARLEEEIARYVRAPYVPLLDRVRRDA